MAVSFDLFGTLVTADRPAEPWAAVADALRDRGVAVPRDWEAAYRTGHVETEPLGALSLVAHTRAALASRDVAVTEELAHEALLDAFDGPVEVADGARGALRVAASRGSVGLLSNCSVPGLVERTLARAELTRHFDAIVASVDCGWRKPHDHAFTRIAGALGVDPESLVHVGDDPRTDGGGRTAGVTVLLTDGRSLAAVTEELEELP